MSTISSVKQILDKLGLSEHYRNFIDNGYDSLTALKNITSDDMYSMGLSEAHQQKIINFLQDNPSLNADPVRDSRWPGISERDIDPSLVDTPGYHERSLVESWPLAEQPQWELTRQKRKWERRPELDLNAPVKPPTAYVAFSNAVRDELDGRSFTEISKTAGRRWSSLPTEEKQALEREALKLRGKYRMAMDNYKGSKEQKEYEDYIRKFKETKGRGDTHRPSLVYTAAERLSTATESLPLDLTTPPGISGPSTWQAESSSHTIISRESREAFQGYAYLSSSPSMQSSSSSSSVASLFSSFRSTPTAPLSYSGDSSRSQMGLISSGQEMNLDNEGGTPTPKEGQKRPFLILPSITASVAGLPSEFTSRDILPHNSSPPGASHLPAVPFEAILPPLPPQSGTSPRSPTSLLPYSLSYHPRSNEDDLDHGRYTQTGVLPEPGPTTEYPR